MAFLFVSFFFERAPGKPKPFGFSRSTVGDLFFASGKQRDRGHIKYDKGAVRRRGEKESLTADGLWFTGCSLKEKAGKEVDDGMERVALCQGESKPPPYKNGKTFFAMFAQTKKAPLCKGSWRASA